MSPRTRKMTLVVPDLINQNETKKMKTLVIADDVDVSRKLLSILLSRHGYRVMDATDGNEALGLIRSEHPELAIVDLFMPAMDGFELVRAIRSDSEIAGTPVIFFSSTYAAEDVRALATALGVRHLLQKSSAPSQVLDAVREAESNPFGSSGEAFFHLDERFEDGVDLVRWNSPPRVTHFQKHDLLPFSFGRFRRK